MLDRAVELERVPSESLDDGDRLSLDEGEVLVDLDDNPELLDPALLPDGDPATLVAKLDS